MRARWLRSATILVALLLMVAACGGGGESTSSSGGGGELKHVTIRMDWTAGGYHAPFVLAQDKGYYAEEGLDVSVLEGKGSTSTAQVVANGGDTFGFVQFGSAMALIAQGAPLVGTAPIIQKSTTFIASRKAASILKPEDLVGKRFGYDPGGSDAQMVPLFLRVNGVPEDKVHLVTTTSATTLQLMAQGKIDAATYESIYEIPIMKAQDIPFNGMNFADYGMNIMAYTIITNTKTVKDDPDLVKGFTKASLKGWEYAVDHPQEAIDALKKQFSSVDANNALQQFQLTIPLLHTDSTKDKPIGCADAKDVLNTESLLVKAGLIKNATEDPAKYLAEGYAPC